MVMCLSITKLLFSERAISPLRLISVPLSAQSIAVLNNSSVVIGSSLGIAVTTSFIVPSVYLNIRIALNTLSISLYSIETPCTPFPTSPTSLSSPSTFETNFHSSPKSL